MELSYFFLAGYFFAIHKSLISGVCLTGGIAFAVIVGEMMDRDAIKNYNKTIKEVEQNGI